MRRFFARLANLLRPRRAEREMTREIASHLALIKEEYERRGLTPGQAQRAARLAYGGTEQAAERHREARSFFWIEQWAKDLRYAGRSLRRAPAFALAAVVTLGLGLGGATAIFAVINRVLLQPLPYPHADRLVQLRQFAPGAPGLADFVNGLDLSASMYVTYAERNHSFSALGIWDVDTASVTGRGEPEQVRVLEVSNGVLQALAVPPATGRWLEASDQQPNGPRHLMLSYGYWQRRFGSDRASIGHSITVNSQPWQVVGVMPRGFRVVDTDPDLMVPLRLDRGKLTLAGFGFNGLARLQNGATIAQANADLKRLLPIWMDSFSNGPGTDAHAYEIWRITPALQPLKAAVVGNAGAMLWVVTVTLGLVLLIACANVTNLFFVRVEARQHELAIRAALGAGAGRLRRALLTESIAAALLGGILGAGLAEAGLRLLQAMAPASMPRLNEIALDGTALAFAFALALAAGVVCGLVPALKYAGPRVATALRAAGRTASANRESQRTRNLLVVAQVAMALVLLISAGLLIRTFEALRTVAPGFTDAATLQTFRLSIPPTLIPSAEQVTRTQQAIADKLATIPGVRSAAFADEMPIEDYGSDWDTIVAQNRPVASDQMPPLRYFKEVSPEFFSTVGTRLLAGRGLTWTDVYSGRPVVLVSESLADIYWGGVAAAVGQHLREYAGQPWREVIGVVEDVRENGIEQPSPPIVYWPTTRAGMYRPGNVYPLRTATFVLRSTRAGSASLLADVRRAVESVNASLPVATPRTMEQICARSLAPASFTMVMLAIAGVVALTLGVVGIYGVVAYGVAQRRREIAIRLALGAEAGEVRRMFMRRGLGLAAVGAAFGLAAAAPLAGLLKSLLYDISPLDPLTYIAVPVVLLAAVGLASYLPARGATAVAPAEALQAE